MSRAKTPKTAVYNLYDSEPDMAVVRAPDDDDRAFWALTVGHIREHEWRYPNPPADDMTDADLLAWAKLIIAPPKWRWYRKNVCTVATQDAEGWTWTLGYPRGPGPGNWRGAIVRLIGPAATS